MGIFDEKEKWIKWNGTYRGVFWEINYRDGSNVPAYSASWYTYYVVLFKELLREEDWNSFLSPKGEEGFYDYRDNPLKNLPFHFGITYYDGTESSIRIGCDYNHVWDEEREYSLETVYSDIREMIDAFRERYKYRRWCGQCGAIVDESEGKPVCDPDEGAYCFVCNNCLDMDKGE